MYIIYLTYNCKNMLKQEYIEPIVYTNNEAVKLKSTSSLTCFFPHL